MNWFANMFAIIGVFFLGFAVGSEPIKERKSYPTIIIQPLEASLWFPDIEDESQFRMASKIMEAFMEHGSIVSAEAGYIAKKMYEYQHGDVE